MAKRLLTLMIMAAMAAAMMAQDQPAYPLTRAGNSYYYAGEEMSQREMLEWYARQNCTAAYEQFRSAQQMATAGWVFLGIGAAMDLGGATCIGIMAYRRYQSAANQSNQAPAWQKNPDYTYDPLRTAAISLTVGAFAFEAACIPLLVVGYHKMHSSVNIYNSECNAAYPRPQASRPYWTIQTSGSGLGLALNF